MKTRLVGVFAALLSLSCEAPRPPAPKAESNASATQKAPPPKTAAAPFPTLTAPRLSPGSVLVMDGALDEPAWRDAADTGTFVDVSTGRENPKLPVQGRARLLWDDDAFYVGFEVQDRDVRGGFPEGAIDPHLWERDTIEIMIDPDGNGDNLDYYEIQINPQGLVFDSQFDGYNRPNGGGKGPFGHEEWSADAVRKVVVKGTLDDASDRDEGYVVEAKIPWKGLSLAKSSPPKAGDTWRMNFYAMQDNGGVSWSPILRQGNFHKASRFGRVTWSATAP